MRSRILTGLIILTLVFTACSQAETAEEPAAVSTVDTGDGAISLYVPPEGTATPVPTAAPPIFQASAPAACSVVSTDQTPAFPEVSASDWVKGPADAAVTIIEYSDFQCPYCAQFSNSADEILAMYPDDVRIVFRHFPLLSIHPNAAPAMIASEAAGRQDAFWEMHDLLFANQSEWSSLSTDAMTTYLVGLAEELELDTIQFELDMNDQEVIDLVDISINEGFELGIPGTPFILINGSVFQTSLEVADIADQISIALNADSLEIQADDWVFGPEDASVTIVEYTDLQCAYCAETALVLKQLAADFPEDLSVVIRHFPIDEIHANARLAAAAAEAAGMQGAFEEMTSLLFANQSEWAELESSAFVEYLETAAADLNLDAEQFAADLTSEETAVSVQADYDMGLALGVQGTPSFFFDGEPYQGPSDYDSLVTLINLLLLDEIQFSDCPPMLSDFNQEYYATMKTEKGDITFQLFADKAPMAVSNFIFLAENDWYDNTTFHRVLPGFIAQGGDPTGTGYGSPGYAFDIEVSPELLFDREGLLAMANAGPTSNGSQFFITHDNYDIIQLSGQYTIFGIVIEGMDVVYELTERNPQPDGPNLPPGDLLLDVIIETR